MGCLCSTSTTTRPLLLPPPLPLVTVLNRLASNSILNPIAELERRLQSHQWPVDVVREHATDLAVRWRYNCRRRMGVVVKTCLRHRLTLHRSSRFRCRPHNHDDMQTALVITSSRTLDDRRMIARSPSDPMV